MNRIAISILIVCVFSALAFAQLENANKTLIHTQTARTMEKGQLSVYPEMNFYSKAPEYLGSLRPDNFRTVNYWLVAGNGVISYGIMNHLDVSLGIRVYQDTHRSNEYNLPDDLFLTLKAGSFTFGQGHFHNAFITSLRIPTAEVHNYLFTPYASGALEYGFMYALSFYADRYLPDRTFNMHFNLGFWNHNEAGKVLYEFERNFGGFSEGDELEATVNSKELRLALAAVMPTSLFDFRLELSGILYLTDPDPFVYSAEEWAFLTPSIRYKPLEWVSFDLGLDIRLSPAERERTTAVIPKPSQSLDLPPNYPGWKVHMGTEISFNVLSKTSRRSGNFVRREAEERIELFETILDEQDRARAAQDELEALREIRREAEKEIEELKKILED